MLWAGSGLAADDDSPNRKPVKAVGDQRLVVRTAAGVGELVLYASQPLNEASAQTDIERAVLVFHGRQRNAEGYWLATRKAARAAGDAGRHSLLIAPQFLAERDVKAHGLSAQTLRWSPTDWTAGSAALGPAAISPYETIDALLSMLADRQRFPRLKQVVIAGHSGGGQVVQRYAVVGQGESQLAAVGVKVRYVVANPSSYLYFSDERPRPNGTFAAPAPAPCPTFNRWKFGWESAPPYAQSTTPAAYESRFLKRDVVYLLGAADTDPNHPALDKSCGAEAQGAHRLVRGHNYLAYLRRRHPDLAPTAHDVPGVGHDGDRMLNSACALAALFDDPQAAAGCR